jgi:hypothetical protein
LYGKISLLSTPKVLANKDNLVGSSNKESLNEILCLQLLALSFMFLNILSFEVLFV